MPTGHLYLTLKLGLGPTEQNADASKLRGILNSLKLSMLASTFCEHLQERRALWASHQVTHNVAANSHGMAGGLASDAYNGMC